MTLKLPHHLAAQADEFAKTVTEHLAHLNVWFRHMARVEADKAAGVTDPILKHEPYPAPHASDANVGAAVRFDEVAKRFVADYEFETAPTVPLEEKRNKLLIDLHAAEVAAHAKIMHPGKTRLFNLQLSQAHSTPENYRTDEHKQLIAHAAETHKWHHAINLHFAQLEAEIADLTAETIDGWHMKPFPGA